MIPAAAAGSAPAPAAPPPTAPESAANSSRRSASASSAPLLRTKAAGSASARGSAPASRRRTPAPQRPGAWCGPCGGIRGPHTFHHDDAAHQRARRRYDGLRAKAASTSYPHEADACHAKADAMRDKYGL
jgi:hypothetical protein